LKVVPELTSNSVTVSGSEQEVQGIRELIRKLDIQPDVILLEIVMAEKGADEPVDEREMDHLPDALAAWARQHGRLQVLCRSQIMAVNNTSGSIQLGNRENQSQHILKLDVTPRITSDGKGLVVELVVGKSKTINEESGHWTKEEISSGTKIAADDGKTVVVTGLKACRDGDEPELVIAMTPHIVGSNSPATNVR
jgi:type II secretory pathway component GspD/PulD (secretin)